MEKNNNNKIISLDKINLKNKNKIKWTKSENVYKNGKMLDVPLKVWQNLEDVLKANEIELKYNVITHDIVSNKTFISRNCMLTDIYALQIAAGLKLTREETAQAIDRIAMKNKFNPFAELVKQNENKNEEFIKELFSCLKIDCDENNKKFYYILFKKWLINVVKMAFNEGKYHSEGVLVLQGKQGIRKTTFCRNLLKDPDLFKSDESLKTEDKDSVIRNTSYLLVEWGELDSTLKGEQAALKKFITADFDEFRAPYSRYSEKHPRKTSFIGTVNQKDFLKDETGSRRFWIIPLVSIDIEKQLTIDMNKVWGAAYGLWKSGEVVDYLDDNELSYLNYINSKFNFTTDIGIILDEKINWNVKKESWQIYNITEICDALYITERKKVKIELEKRGLEYKVHRTKTGTKKGFKIPPIKNYGPYIS